MTPKEMAFFVEHGPGKALAIGLLNVLELSDLYLREKALGISIEIKGDRNTTTITYTNEKGECVWSIYVQYGHNYPTLTDDGFPEGEELHPYETGWGCPTINQGLAGRMTYEQVMLHCLHIIWTNLRSMEFSASLNAGEDD